MSIKENFELESLERKLEQYSSEENYQRTLGFDDQDEHTHLIGSQRMQIENEIKNLESEYKKEMHKIAKKIISDASEHINDIIEDILFDCATNYTDDDYEQEELSYDAMNNIEIIIQCKK